MHENHLLQTKIHNQHHTITEQAVSVKHRALLEYSGVTGPRSGSQSGQLWCCLKVLHQNNKDTKYEQCINGKLVAKLSLWIDVQTEWQTSLHHSILVHKKIHTVAVVYSLASQCYRNPVIFSYWVRCDTQKLAVSGPCASHLL